MKPLKTRKPTFVTRYSPTAKRIFKILCKHWTAIYTRIPILKRFLKCISRLAYRANPNCKLAKKLVRAKLKPIQGQILSPHTLPNKANAVNTVAQMTQTFPTWLTLYTLTLTHTLGYRNGMSPSSNSICPLHSQLINSQQVCSEITRTYNTHGQATCDTSCIVYLIKCTICGQYYVGKTQQVDILISKNQALQILYLKNCVYKTTQLELPWIRNLQNPWKFILNNHSMQC